MKLLLDANLSPKIARALHILVEGDGHEVHALRDKFPENTPDVDWLSALMKESGWAVLTFDRRITKRPHEREAWLRSGVVYFALEPAWSKGMDPLKQTAGLLKIWPNFVKVFETVKPPAGFEVHIQGKFSQLRVG